MPTTKQALLSGPGLLRGILYLLLASTTLVIAINANDSSVAKTPFLVLLASLMVIGFAAQAIWNGKIELRRSRADIPVVLMLGLMLVSTTYAPDRWTSLRALAIWLSFIICFFAGSQLFASQPDLTRLIRIIAAIASVVCAVGLIQYSFADKLYLNFFIGIDRRVSSTLTNATYLSGYIVLLFPTLLAFALAKRRTPRERLLFGLLLCALVFLLVATSTRSSLIAFVVSIAMFVVLTRRARKTSIWAAGAIVAALSIALYLSPTMVRRIDYAFSQDPSSSFARRLYFWQAGFDAFKAAPLVGHGIGSLETAVLQYRSPEYWIVKSEDVVPHAHNEFVETAVDLGGFGVVLYLAILVTVVAAAVKTRARENPQEKLMAVGLLCSLVAILVDNLANMSLRVVPVGATAWLLMGVLAAQPFRKEPDMSVAVHIPKLVALLPLLAWIAFAVWYTGEESRIYKSEAYLIKGIFEEQNGGFAASIPEFESSVTQNPHNLLARSNLILASLRIGHASEALQSSEQLRALSSRYPKVNLMEAAALIGMRQYKEALESINRELALRTHPEAYDYQAVAFRGLSDRAGELSALEGLLNACIKGQMPYAFELVAARTQELARTEQDNRHLKGIFEHLFSLFPSNRDIGLALAEFHRRLGEHDQAKQLLLRFTQDPPGR